MMGFEHFGNKIAFITTCSINNQQVVSIKSSILNINIISIKVLVPSYEENLTI